MAYWLNQLPQLVGALMILAAYAMAQLGGVSQTSRLYLVLNLTGSATLGVIAWEQGNWGFVLLEGVWAGLSAWSLIKRI